jgi:hypothetical protein
MRTGFRWESQKERDHYEDTDGGGWIILHEVQEGERKTREKRKKVRR